MPIKYDRHLIAPFDTGLENDLEPWILPEDAFEILQDAYVFRGRVHKRFGYTLFGNTAADEPQRFSRLRINIGTTNGGGNLGATIVPGGIFKVGQMFSVGTNIFTVNTAGNPAAMLAKGTGTGTYSTTTGTVTITGSDALTAVYFYPAEPVMGLLRRELATINNEETLAFDTQFAYRRSGGAWERLGTNTPAPAAGIWSGSNSQFFWSTNFRGNQPYNTYFYVVNFNRADQIQYIPQGSAVWSQLRPQLDAGGAPVRFLDSCRILLPFKDRLVALNTLETDGGNQTFPNRCRFSQNGDPTAPATSWLDDTPGRGGYIDAPTKEAIITAEFIKDRLIVSFEASTWELVYTGNEILPFRWQQINTELGAESTFSRVAFDKAILTVGNVGVHACNGVNVDRIDQKIPDEVFKIHNGNDGVERVYGIRDFFSELVYWTFPTATLNPTFPNRILLYNYRNQSWAFFKDTFTCFGYFQPVDDLSWATLPYPTWQAWTTPWGSGALQSEFLQICAGNQEGFTFIINRDNASNAQAYQITDITAGATSSTFLVIDHNVDVGDVFLIEDAGGVTFTRSGTTTPNVTTAEVISITDNDNIVLDIVTTGTYTGGGTLRRLSGIDIRTKRYNPYIGTASNFYLAYIDFFVDKTTDGEVSIDYYPNSSEYSMATFGYNNATFSGSGALLGSNILTTAPYTLEPFEAVQDKFWHRFYFGTEAFNLQLRLYLTPEQLKDTDIAFSDFKLHGMMLYTTPEGRLQ